MVYHYWGSRSSETACVRAPASRLGGGELSGTGIVIGNEKKRQVPRFKYCASTAPPNVAENNYDHISKDTEMRRSFVCTA